MYKKILFLLLCSFICLNVSHAWICNQESANTTNQTGTDGDCNLTYNGAYANNSFLTNTEYSYDGNWSTNGIYSGGYDFPSTCSTNPSAYYVNYSLPNNTDLNIQQSYTMYKHPSNSETGGGSLSGCSILGNKIQLYIKGCGYHTGGWEFTLVYYTTYCLLDNGTWKEVYIIGLPQNDNNFISEEFMSWAIVPHASYNKELKMIDINDNIFIRLSEQNTLLTLYGINVFTINNNYWAEYATNNGSIYETNGTNTNLFYQSSEFIPNNTYFISTKIENSTDVPRILFSDKYTEQPFIILNGSEQNNTGAVNINSTIPSQDATYPYIFYWNVTVTTGSQPTILLLSINDIVVKSITLQNNCDNTLALKYYLSNGAKTLTAQAGGYSTSTQVSASNSNLTYDEQHIDILSQKCTGGIGAYTGNGTVSGVDRSGSGFLQFWFNLMPNAYDGFIILIIMFTIVGIYLSVATQHFGSLPISVMMGLFIGLIIYGNELFGILSPIGITTFGAFFAIAILWILYQEFKTATP
jgi:hypothetical protein